ncbi:hypothetical protein BH11CYA1_BH11CYA1_25950 [soil metagenome]
MTSLSQTVNKKTALALTLSGFLFAVAVGLTTWSIAQLRDAQYLVDHTHAVILGCKDLFVLCLDVETGQRGYVATGDQRFLEPLAKSRGLVDESAARLIALTVDDQEENQRMIALRAKCAEKLKFIEEVVELYKTNPKSSIEMVATRDGKLIMDQARQLIAQVQEHQADLLAKRKAAVNLLQSWIGVLIALFTVLEAASLFYIYKLNNDYGADQRRRTAELENEIKLRKASEQSLREASLFLERSNQDLQQFAYVASHDLQEPLRAVQGFTTLLAKTYKGKFDEKGDAWIEQVVSGVERMRSLISGLLEYARVESRGAEMQKVDLNNVVVDVLKDLALAIDESSAVIKIDQSLPTVRGDAGQLRQLFTNLIGNAIKYRSERKLEIEVSALRIEPNWQICIEDNGIGFDMQHQEKIFVIFQRLHSRSQYEGTGIGLALCRRIAERHRGEIVATSTPDVGSKFIIKFPIEAEAGLA